MTECLDCEGGLVYTDCLDCGGEGSFIEVCNLGDAHEFECDMCESQGEIGTNCDVCDGTGDLT